MNRVNVQTWDKGQICPDLGVAVLAGGASRRFGSDKALFRIDDTGPTLIERIVTVAKQLSDEVTIIGHKQYENIKLGVPVVADDYPQRGPLGGIATALRALLRPRVLVLACDMPCLSIPLLSWMAKLETDADVVVPQTNDGQFQPAHAIYRLSALPAIETALATSNGAVTSFFPSVRLRVISESEMRIFDPGLDSIVSLNRPEDLNRVNGCIGRN